MMQRHANTVCFPFSFRRPEREREIEKKTLNCWAAAAFSAPNIAAGTH